MKKDLAQLNFIKDILNLIDTAWSINKKSEKLMLNFSSFLSSEEQTDLLKDLKEKKAIGDFKTQSDYFSILFPSHNLLLEEYNRLSPKYEQSDLSGQPISLKGQSVSYNDKKSAVLIGENKVFLPPDKNEDIFCRVMFKHQVEEVVDWTVIFTAMNGLEPSFESKKAMEKNKRSVQDTMRRLNDRVKTTTNTQDDLFAWEERTIKRLY